MNIFAEAHWIMLATTSPWGLTPLGDDRLLRAGTRFFSFCARLHLEGFPFGYMGRRGSCKPARRRPPSIRESLDRLPSMITIHGIASVLARA